MSNRGVLFLVGTPIGNMDDITVRAKKVLSEVDFIVAENMRRTRNLLRHHHISTHVESYREENSLRKAPEVVERLKGGMNAALVSDAGMPGISDPGTRLVRLAVSHGLRIEVVPGPSALIAALAGSGLSPCPFHFEGFLPRVRPKRLSRLEEISHFGSTLVFFEAPHRIRDSLEDMIDVLGDRECVLARELTKVHEEFLRGRLSQVLSRLEKPRGEFTLVVSGLTGSLAIPDEEVRSMLSNLISQGLSRSDAIKAVSNETGVSKNIVYGVAHRNEVDDS